MRPLPRAALSFILVAASLLGFIAGGYYSRASMAYLSAYFASLLVAGWFALKFPASSLGVFGIASLSVAFAVEPSMSTAGFWHYSPTGEGALLYPLLSYSAMVLLVVLLATILRKWAAGMHAKSAAMLVVPPSLAVLTGALMWIEGYSNLLDPQSIIVYSLLVLLSLYHTLRSPTTWNLSLVLGAVIVAGGMEAAGSLSGLWSYPNSRIVPLFLPVSWSLNVLAIFGLARILGADLSSASGRIKIASFLPRPAIGLPPPVPWPRLVLQLSGAWSLASSIGLLLGLGSVLSLLGVANAPLANALQIGFAFSAAVGLALMLASEDPATEGSVPLVGALVLGLQSGLLALASQSLGQGALLFLGLATIAGASAVALVPVYMRVLEQPQPPQPEILRRQPGQAKRVLILYFSVTGQTRRATESLAKGLEQEGCEVTSKSIEPVDEIPFPFTPAYTLRTIFQTASGAFLPLKPVDVKSENAFDLIVIGSPTWWISPTPAVWSIFSDARYMQLLENRNVALLVVCRALWKRNVRMMQQRLMQDAKSRFVDALALQHRGEEPFRFITLIVYLWRGKLPRDRFFGRRLGPYGLGDRELEQARLFGVKLGRLMS